MLSFPLLLISLCMSLSTIVVAEKLVFRGVSFRALFWIKGFNFAILEWSRDLPGLTWNTAWLTYWLRQNMCYVLGFSFIVYLYQLLLKFQFHSTFWRYLSPQSLVNSVFFVEDKLTILLLHKFYVKLFDITILSFKPSVIDSQNTDTKHSQICQELKY